MFTRWISLSTGDRSGKYIIKDSSEVTGALRRCVWTLAALRPSAQNWITFLIAGTLCSIFLLWPYFYSDFSWNLGDESSYFEPTYHFVSEGTFGCPFVADMIPNPDRSCFLQPPLWGYFLIPFVKLARDKPYYAVRYAQAGILLVWLWLYSWTWKELATEHARAGATRKAAPLYMMLCAPLAFFVTAAYSLNGRMDLLAGVLLLQTTLLCVEVSPSPVRVGLCAGLTVSVHPLAGLAALSGAALTLLLSSAEQRIGRCIRLLASAVSVLAVLWIPLILLSGFRNFLTQFGANIAMNALRASLADRLLALVRSPLYSSTVLAVAGLLVCRRIMPVLLPPRLQRTIEVCTTFVLAGGFLIAVIAQPSYQYIIQLHPILSVALLACSLQVWHFRSQKLILAVGLLLLCTFTLRILPLAATVSTRPLEAVLNGPNTLKVATSPLARAGAGQIVLTDAQFYYAFRPEVRDLYDLEYFARARTRPGEYNRFDLIILRETDEKGRWFYVPFAQVRDHIEKNFTPVTYRRLSQRFRWRSFSWRAEREDMIVYHRKVAEAS